MRNKKAIWCENTKRSILDNARKWSPAANLEGMVTIPKTLCLMTIYFLNVEVVGIFQRIDQERKKLREHFKRISGL